MKIEGEELLSEVGAGRSRSGFSLCTAHIRLLPPARFLCECCPCPRADLFIFTLTPTMLVFFSFTDGFGNHSSWLVT